MASLIRNVTRSLSLTKNVSKYKSFPIRSYAATTASICKIPMLNNFGQNQSLLTYEFCKCSSISLRQFSNNEVEKPPGLVARFKQMYRDYWYVLVPVHLATSIGWFGGFYYLAKSGVDVVAIMNAIGCSESITAPLKDSSMGYVALAYAMYKIATPIRYTVTLGGTTISIKYLKLWGYIKPIPSRGELKEMYQVKKDGLQDMYQETKQELRQRKDQIRERKDHVMSDIARYNQEMRDIKEREIKNK